MQKVEGSSPFIRFTESPGNGASLLPGADAESWSATGTATGRAAGGITARQTATIPTAAGNSRRPAGRIGVIAA